MLKSIAANKRSIFYGVLVGLGLLFGLQILKDYGPKEYVYTICGIMLIVFFEIYLNWRYATRILRQVDLPTINVYSLWSHILNHIMLPVLLLLSVSGFIFFHRDDLVRVIVIVLVSIVFVTLFINIRSYYEDEFRVEEKTRYIYEIMKLVIFFFGLNLVISIEVFWGIDIWISAFLVSLLVIILGMLLIYRKNQFELVQIIYIVLSASIIAVLFLVLHNLEVLMLGINVIIFLVFYFLFSLLNHRLERTLTKEIFIEYGLILLFAFLLFSGIS
ncbi:MAG: hypothetical protein PHS44_02525 [Candidatus Dojkabacteria bacterium]|nr:hypothetical protein [Candidatus Dojkabacteria bacterium]